MTDTIFTVGHSTHTIEFFLELLARNKVSAIGDVRSTPYSRANPQFNRESLSESLEGQGIKYVFLGRELGARSDDPACYRDGRVRYDALARTALFQDGIRRIHQGARRGYKMALMCAEKDPLDCHRTVLLARNLEPGGFRVSHILGDGSLETQEEATRRLLEKFRLGRNEDLFSSVEDLRDKAFQKQEQQIAYTGAAGQSRAGGTAHK